MIGEKGFMALRQIQIMLRIFNIANEIVIFTMKHATIWNFIFLEYVIIVNCLENPLLGTVMMVAFIVCFIHAVVHQKAFATPDNAEKAKKTLLLRWYSMCSKQGHLTGGFHHMERTSTPQFVDFVVQNVVGSLITLS